ncbi:MAG TPA: sulfide/dihydroorotate dehydrogenase-like FAD/NAD-binding protein [Clostridiales bacterium]|nr:sulfide/dihydroorotate dehydrogenase-like FAD/NAD-binding protein [Clostridiales bacterium]
MFEIVNKRSLNEQVKAMEILAPHIARKAKPGQFIILRVSEEGKRIPLTIAGMDSEKGTVTIIFQEVGLTTRLLGRLKTGDSLLDFVGPLGVPTHLEGYKNAAVIGGGLGTAIAYPQAKHLHQLGTRVESILGFRTKDLIILENEMAAVSDSLFIATDDGSNGVKGFVTDLLKKRIEEGAGYDLVIAIGPLVMMRAVSNLTRTYGIKTLVSMNPVMVDGTGMCGGCRVTVGGETKFACVDGPDFDGHLVDFDEAIRRSRMYGEEERKLNEMHKCNLGLEK